MLLLLLGKTSSVQFKLQDEKKLSVSLFMCVFFSLRSPVILWGRSCRMPFIFSSSSLSHFQVSTYTFSYQMTEMDLTLTLYFPLPSSSSSSNSSNIATITAPPSKTLYITMSVIYHDGYENAHIISNDPTLPHEYSKDNEWGKKKWKVNWQRMKTQRNHNDKRFNSPDQLAISFSFPTSIIFIIIMERTQSTIRKKEKTQRGRMYDMKPVSMVCRGNKQKWNQKKFLDSCHIVNSHT